VDFSVPDRPVFDAALSRAVLRAVADGRLPETLRVYQPADVVAFSALDRVRPGFPAAVRDKALIDIFGYDNIDEYLKVPLLDQVAPESREFIRSRMEKRQKGEPLEPRFEYKIQRKDGEIRDIEISVGEIFIGKEKYTQGSFRDVTERKEAEDALKESQKLLETIVELTPT
jgi:PAS domain S-box-containing protein